MNGIAKLILAFDVQVPVVTATFPVDRNCQYHEGTFPHFQGLEGSIMYVRGIQPLFIESMKIQRSPKKKKGGMCYAI